MTDRLTELRDTIDRLDDEILALIQRRMKLSADIIAAKTAQLPIGLVAKPWLYSVL